jgi:phospholipid transport system substrate-binding protein
MSLFIDRTMRRVVFACATLLAGAAFAVTAQSASSPDQVIQSATQSVKQNIDANHARYQRDKSAFYSYIDQEVAQLIDTSYVAKIILGTHLKQATPEQVKRFERAFTNRLIRQYADEMLENYQTVQVEVKPARVDGDKATVDTVINRGGGKPPVAVQFRLRQRNGEWKIWDLTAENISVVLNFRSQIDAEIKKSSIDAVIDRLEKGELQVQTPEGEGAAATPQS